MRAARERENEAVQTVSSTRGRALRLGAALLTAALALASGCGMAGGSEGAAALVSGLPKCDPSLLHPRITVGAAAGLPGKLIVYVDGVMACVDDANRVDQILSQVDGHAGPSPRPMP